MQPDKAILFNCLECRSNTLASVPYGATHYSWDCAVCGTHYDMNVRTPDIPKALMMLASCRCDEGGATDRLLEHSTRHASLLHRIRNWLS